MTPEQIALVQSSFERLGPELPAMTARFYQELFGRDPSLRPMFSTDRALQQTRFTEKAATREAWAIAYNLVAETTLEGAASARPVRT